MKNKNSRKMIINKYMSINQFKNQLNKIACKSCNEKVYKFEFIYPILRIDNYTLAPKYTNIFSYVLLTKEQFYNNYIKQDDNKNKKIIYDLFDEYINKKINIINLKILNNHINPIKIRVEYIEVSDDNNESLEYDYNDRPPIIEATILNVNSIN